MLFSRKIEPHCAYCRQGARLDDGKVMCLKKGIVPASSHCYRFRYDPLKRIPPRPQPFQLKLPLSDEDFSL